VQLVDISGGKKRKKKREHLNIIDLHTGVRNCKKDYQPRTNTVRDQKSGLFADPRSILARSMNRFHHLLNVRWVKEVKQTEKH
jgi:hypothetical protein